MSIKIAIIGGGHSAKRFVEANLEKQISLIHFNDHTKKVKKLASLYSIPIIKEAIFLKDPNIFDICILAVHSDVAEKILKKIIAAKYKKNIIFEKPFAKSLKEFNNILNELKQFNNNFCIMYNRRFEEKFRLSEKPKEYNWKLLVNEKRFKNVYIDYLPHILDYAFYLENCYKFNLNEFQNGNDYKTLLGRIGNDKKFSIYFYKVDFVKSPIYMLNGIEFKVPNYFESHSKVIDYILNNQNDKRNYIKSAFSIAKLLEVLEG